MRIISDFPAAASLQEDQRARQHAQRTRTGFLSSRWKEAKISSEDMVVGKSLSYKENPVPGLSAFGISSRALFRSTFFLIRVYP